MCLGRPLTSASMCAAGEFVMQPRDGLGHVALALDALFVEQLRDALVGGRFLEAEREVFELPLQLPDAEPVRERCVDLERFACNFGRGRDLGRRVVAQRLHARREPDQHHANVLRERQQHLAQRLHLGTARGLGVAPFAAGLGRGVLRRRAQAHAAKAQQLAHVEHELDDLGAKARFERALRICEVRGDIEERRRQHRGRIDIQTAHDRRRALRVLDERLASGQTGIARMLAHECKCVVERWERGARGGFGGNGRYGVAAHETAPAGVPDGLLTTM